MYFTGAYCAILVFDVESKESFDVLDSDFFESLQSRAPSECIYVLAGNVQDKTKERQVEKEEALDYSQKIDIFTCFSRYFKVLNIKEMFQYIAECPDLHYEEDLSDKYLSDQPPENSDKKNNKCF